MILNMEHKSFIFRAHLVAEKELKNILLKEGIDWEDMWRIILHWKDAEHHAQHLEIQTE